MIVTTDLRSVLAMLSVALGSLAVHPQVQTEAPPPVPGAKPVALERIKVHGAALEGNLEGNAADRDVLAVLPPSYAKEKSRRFEHLRDLHRHPHEQVADCFQNHVLPFCSRILCVEKGYR
jgi:hypothetical protein